MKRLYLLCGLVAGALVALTAYYRSEPDTFYGIADARENVISSEGGVEIRRIPVVEGQMVRMGDTLLAAHNPELELRLSQISHELNELRTRKSAHATLTRTEILQLKAQQEERVSEIRAEIRELEAQYELNKQLVSELRSLDREKSAGSGDADDRNPILVKIKSLRRMLELAQDPSKVYENRLASALSSDGDPLSEQISRLEDEMRILEADRQRLLFTAQIDGVIGSVNFKVGDKVSAFTPILTLHAASPSFVRGYIHEDVYSQVGVREKVRVQGIQNHAKPVEGVVVGVGTRIVEYPERLRKRADILIWGREVIIQIPPGNRFLLGEKVRITLPKGMLKGTPSKALSAIQAPAVAGFAAAKREAGMDLPGIEASGLIWLPDAKRFLIISDDNPKKQPLLHLSDASFRGLRAVSVQGLDKMDDMEGVSAGPGGAIYLLSSQSHNKKGKLADARKLLIKADRKGEVFNLAGKVLLLDLLGAAAAENPKADWAVFLTQAKAAHTVDIEGMAIRGDTLLLGFKAPLLDGKAVILRIADVDGLFKGGTPKASRIAFWKTLDLRGADAAKTPCGIADIAFAGGDAGGDAYLVSTGTSGQKDPNGGEGAHVGELWHLPAGAVTARRIHDFGGEKPEGLAWLAEGNSLAVAFDNGSDKPSRAVKMEIPK